MSELQPMPKQSNFRFWCQKVLPLVYDESLSYYELLNKVIAYLNNTIADVGTCETNIDLLLQAFEQLQEYVNDQIASLSPVVEEVIDQMVESGEFGDILVDAIADVIAEEYDPTESYVPLNYVLYNGDLYCCTANTTGEFDPTKWRQTTVGDDLNALMVRVYTLKASQVGNDSSVTGTTVKDALNTLKTALNTKAEYLNLGNIPPAEFTTREAQIEEALNRINIYDKPVIFYYTSSGRWSGIALKYTDGHYGYIIANYPNDNATYFGYLVDDVFSVHRFAGSSNDIKNESNVQGTTVTNALNNLNGSLPTFDENNPNNTSCASNTVTTLANLNLTKGSWILIGSHEWSENVNAQYIDYFLNTTDNKTIAITRNLSMASGGGATMTAFLTLETAKNVRFATYNVDTQTRTAKTIKFAAIKIA